MASDFPDDDVFDVDQDLLQANNKPVRQQLTFRSAYGGDNSDYTAKKGTNNDNNNNKDPANNTKSNFVQGNQSTFDAGALKKAMTKAPTKKDPFGTKLSTEFPPVVENCDDPPIVDEEAIKSWIYPSKNTSLMKYSRSLMYGQATNKCETTNSTLSRKVCTRTRWSACLPVSARHLLQP